MGDILENIRQLDVSTVISPSDRMFNPGSERHYYYVGRSNLLILLNVLNIRKAYPGGDAPVTDIFDFGCGHGRINRWLRAGFPDAQIHVTDFDKSGVAFCVEQFGCIDTAGEIPAAKFDIIWLGSVFTHLPARIVTVLMERLVQGLKPNGVLIFSSQGRFAIERIKGFDWEHDKRSWMHYGLSQTQFETLTRLYHETGYGYVDYPRQTDYGVCVAEPGWYARHLLRDTGVIQILFQEKGSDNHQDISAFMRAEITDARKGPLW